jgi:hypothetical protein
VKRLLTAIFFLTLRALLFSQGINLIVGKGAYYSGGNNAYTVIAGDVKNDGQILTPNSNLKITGNTAAQKITCYTLSGSYCPNVYNTSVYNTVLGNVDQENDEGMVIETNVLVIGTHVFIHGSTEIREGNYFLYNSTTPFTGSTATKFFVTSGAFHGLLKQRNIGSSAVLFPVGTAPNLSNYTPASISYSGTADSFGVRVYDNVYAAYYTLNGDPYNGGITNIGFVKKTWIVSKGTPVTSGFAEAGFTATLQWNAVNENSYFTPSRDDDISVARNHDTLWLPQDPQGPSTNPYSFGPYTRTDLVTYDNAFYQYYPIAVSAINHVLPIIGLNLNGNLTGKNVRLKWTTLTEINTAGFNIERSSNGINYNVLGNIPAYGNSSTIRSYSFMDSTANPSLNYYRIRAFDKDGKSILSNTVLIKINQLPKGIILLSNPAINTIKILFKNQPGDYTIDVYNNLGSKIKTGTATIISGEETYSSGVKGLVPGSYYIKIMNHQTREVTTLKVIIIN